MRRIGALLGEFIPTASLVTLDRAAHFMIATHAGEVGRMISAHVDAAEAQCAATESI